MSKVAVAAAAVLLVALAASAERAWVTNRASTTVDLFDAATGAHEGRVTVGSSPVDLAPDAPDTFGPTRLFVANSGSNNLSVVNVNPLGVVATLTGGGSFGTFATPSGVVRAPSGAVIVVDQKVTTYPGTPTGRSTIRFFSPASFAVLDEYRDASPSARYQDIVVTSNGRLWIADDGDQGVTVVRFPPVAPPFGFPRTLIYQGTGEFADFIKDTAVVKSFLVAPRRLATNGTSRVVVADGGSTRVVILDADYPGGSEAASVLQVVDLGAGATAQDVEVVGSFAYVTTAGVNNLHRIDLNTYAVVPTALPGTVAGLGATADATTLFVGAGSGSGLIQSLDLTAAWPPAPVAVPAFPAAGDFPFAFYASPRDASDTPGPPPASSPPPDPPFVSQSNTTSTSNGSNNCGLLGLELLLLFALRRGANKLIRSLR